VHAGAAGGGVGTVLAAIAVLLPEKSAWKQILTMLSPAISVGVGGLWLFVNANYIAPRIRQAAVDKVLSDARAVEQRVLADPNSSAEHKQEMREAVEKLELAAIREISGRFEIVIRG
jgi:uncharacterized membrane protein